MLLAIDTAQWVIFGIILALIIAYPIVIMVSNRKNAEKAKQLTDNLTKGQRILTGTGVVGTIVEIIPQPDGTRLITIETGTKTKSSMQIDSRAVLQILPSEKELAEMERQEREEAKVSQAEAMKEAEVKEEEVTVEKKEATKPASKSKSTTAKSTTKSTASKSTSAKKSTGNSSKKSK